MTDFVPLIVFLLIFAVVLVCGFMFAGTSKDLADLERLRYECKKEIEEIDKRLGKRG